MNGIVACETLYTDIPRFDPEAEVVYVPQWYHEFPIHTPESARAHELLQNGIDTLEERGVDQIIVMYHDSDALTGLQSEAVPLQVYRGRDCIEIHLDGTPNRLGGERKEFGSYYLTRGWIDVAVDSYKLYHAYAGTLDDLQSRFEAAAKLDPEMRVSWPKSEKITQAAARSDSMNTDPAALLRTVIDAYRNVVLIDNGMLQPFHHEYAASFRDFLAEVIPEDDVRDVELRVIEGSLDHLKAVLTDPEAVSEVLTVTPGTPVPEESGFRTGPQHP